MATLLVIIIFTTYVGLGIPDSLFGTAWPAIYTEFDLPISYSNFVTGLMYIGTILSSLMSARLTKKLGTPLTVALSTLSTAAAILGFSFSKNFLMLCLFAIPLGLGAGGIDNVLNTYVALNYKATHVNFLHCSYGVGVALSPYLMSLALKQSNNWQGGYRIMFVFQLALTIMCFLSIPIWNKVKEKKEEAGEYDESKVVSIPELLKVPIARSSLIIYYGSCAIESVCLVWCSTFLVNSKGLTPDKAAEMTMLYFIGMTLGRFISGIFANKIPPKTIIVIGELITFVAILLTLSKNPVICTAGLFMIGLGNGPVFPNMTHLTPIHMGRDIAQSFIGLQGAISYVSILLSPIVFGLLAEKLTTDIFSFFQIIEFSFTAIATITMLKQSKQIQPTVEK
ncbi:MAG: MFS transporter [Clostridia bacterium]|nr:MFS transporter [Clostridia bacterium]